jgi:hypothetical protein
MSGRQRQRARALAAIAALSEQPVTRSHLQWFDLDDESGVLEFHEPHRSLHLALFVVLPNARSKTRAWWATDDGTLVRNAFVGTA